MIDEAAASTVAGRAAWQESSVIEKKKKVSNAYSISSTTFNHTINMLPGTEPWCQALNLTQAATVAVQVEGKFCLFSPVSIPHWTAAKLWEEISCAYG